MPDRTGATMLEDLPEVMMQQILIRLPYKDLVRCRAVSPWWRSATSTTDFMLEYGRRQPLLPIVDGQGRATSFAVFGDGGAGVSSQELWPFLLGPKHLFRNSLKGSCDGFFIIYLCTGAQYTICNPVTRQSLVLPKPQGQFITVIGFYYHRPTGEYRVLWLSQSYEFCRSSMYVLTVGSDKPRGIRLNIPTVSSTSAEHMLMVDLRFSSDDSPAVYHRGSLHWSLYGGSRNITGGCGDIIVFNTEAETFGWMRSPAQQCPKRKLFDMKGTLAFWAGSTPSFTAMDVWVMQDYEAGIWAFKYRIELSTVEASRQLYLSTYKKKRTAPLDSVLQSFNDMAVLNECELLIRFNEKYVLRCDIDGNFLGLIKIGKNQHCMLLTQHRHQESILPIPSRAMEG